MNTNDEVIIEELEMPLDCTPAADSSDDIYSCNERFHEVDGGAALYNNGLYAKYCFRALSKYPILYGYKRYSHGTHRIRFQIQKRTDLRFFFGVMTSLENVHRVMSTESDNRSLYGWWGLNSIVVNGRIKRNQEKNDIENSDELTLILKCDHSYIELEHHRTNRLLKLPIDITLCSFPWKVVVELPTYGDCVRIIP